MAYYVELRPRDTAPLTLEQYKERFAKWLPRHPGATHPDEDPEIRKRYVDDFNYGGGILSVFVCIEVPAGVSAEARISWACHADEVRQLVRELAELAERVSADLYMNNKKIEAGEEEKIVERYVGSKRRIGSVFGTIKG
jgi:hypothetical protein